MIYINILLIMFNNNRSRTGQMLLKGTYHENRTCYNHVPGASTNPENMKSET